MFLDAAHGFLYAASSNDGSLHRVAWDASSPLLGQPVAGRPVGVRTTVSAPGEDWRARGLFNYAG
jgi:hypothetical protein